MQVLMQQHRMNETYTEKPHHMLHGYSVDPYEEEDGYVHRADNRSPRYRDSIAMDTYPLTQGKFDDCPGLPSPEVMCGQCGSFKQLNIQFNPVAGKSPAQHFSLPDHFAEISLKSGLIASTYCVHCER